MFFLQKDLRTYDTHGKLTSMAATPDAHTLMKPSKKIELGPEPNGPRKTKLLELLQIDTQV